MKVRSFVMGSSSLVAAVTLALAGCGGGSGGSSAPKYTGSAKQAAAATITSAGSNGVSSGPVYTAASMTSMMGMSLMSVVSGSMPKLAAPVAPANLSTGQQKIYAARAQAASVFARQLAPIYGMVSTGTTTINQPLSCPGGGSGSVTGTITNTASSSTSDITLSANHCLSAVDTNGHSTELNSKVHVVTSGDATGYSTTIKTGKHAGGSSAWTQTTYYTAAAALPVVWQLTDSDMALSVDVTMPLKTDAKPHFSTVYSLSGDDGTSYYDTTTGAELANYTATGYGFSFRMEDYMPTATSSLDTAVTTLNGGIEMAYVDNVNATNSASFKETFYKLVDSRSFDTTGDTHVITWTLHGSYVMELVPDTCGGSGSMTIATVTPVVYNNTSVPVSYTSGEMTINGTSVVFDAGGITVDGATYATLGDLSAGDCSIGIVM